MPNYPKFLRVGNLVSLCNPQDSHLIDCTSWNGFETILTRQTDDGNELSTAGALYQQRGHFFSGKALPEEIIGEKMSRAGCAVCLKAYEGRRQKIGRAR